MCHDFALNADLYNGFLPSRVSYCCVSQQQLLCVYVVVSSSENSVVGCHTAWLDEYKAERPGNAKLQEQVSSQLLFARLLPTCCFQKELQVLVCFYS